jgi:hypothetical protein
MIRRHPLDVGETEPDWGQLNDGPRDPDPVVAVRRAEPDPEPDWQRLRGDGSKFAKRSRPAPRTPPEPQKQPQEPRAVFSDPSPHEMPGGLIYRPRDRLAPSRRSDLEAIELSAYYASPKWILVQKRKNNAHWLWR